jgi:hypothetical protein
MAAESSEQSDATPWWRTVFEIVLGIGTIFVGILRVISFVLGILILLAGVCAGIAVAVVLFLMGAADSINLFKSPVPVTGSDVGYALLYLLGSLPAGVLTFGIIARIAMEMINFAFGWNEDAPDRAPGSGVSRTPPMPGSLRKWESGAVKGDER